MTTETVLAKGDHHDSALLNLNQEIKEKIKDMVEANIISISHSIVYNPADSGTEQTLFGKWIGSAIITSR